MELLERDVNHCAAAAYKPEEWVAYENGKDMALGRVFCPLLTHDPPEDYVVWTTETDTREVSVSSLHRIMVVSLSGEDVDGDRPPVVYGDDDVDGEGRGQLPLPTPHAPMFSPRYTHTPPLFHSPSHDASSQPSQPVRSSHHPMQDINSFPTSAPVRDGVEGKRWLQQAGTDYLACRLLCDSVDRYPAVCCNVCFMAHEVAEKALKAGRYVTCGMTDPAELIHHRLSHHAYALVSLLPRQLTDRLHEYASYLEPFYLKTRFPNQYQHGIIPFQRFTREDALHAKHVAEEIWRIVYGIFQHFKVPVETLLDK